MHREPQRQSLATYEQYNNIQHDIWRHTKRLVSLWTCTLSSTPSSTHISSLSIHRVLLNWQQHFVPNWQHAWDLKSFIIMPTTRIQGIQQNYSKIKFIVWKKMWIQFQVRKCLGFAIKIWVRWTAASNPTFVWMKLYDRYGYWPIIADFCWTGVVPSPRIIADSIQLYVSPG